MGFPDAYVFAGPPYEKRLNVKLSMFMLHAHTRAPSWSPILLPPTSPLSCPWWQGTAAYSCPVTSEGELEQKRHSTSPCVNQGPTKPSGMARSSWPRPSFAIWPNQTQPCAQRESVDREKTKRPEDTTYFQDNPLCSRLRGCRTYNSQLF